MIALVESMMYLSVIDVHFTSKQNRRGREKFREVNAKTPKRISEPQMYLVAAKQLNKSYCKLNSEPLSSPCFKKGQLTLSTSLPCKQGIFLP